MNWRRGPIALLLSLLQPGVAQLYNREPKKAALAAASTPILLITSRLLALPHSFRGLVIFFLIAMALMILIAADACRSGLRHPKGVLLPKMDRRFLALAIALITVNVAVGGNFFTGRILGVRVWVVRASSMAPTVKEEDRIVVDTLAYRKSSPATGDVIAFVEPSTTSTVFVKRVAALAGDTIEGDSEGLELNGRSVQTLYPAGPKLNYLQVGDFDRVTVPKDSVFVLGDNITNSNDSRYFGPVPIKSVLGKVLFIYWSPQHSRIGQTIR